MAKQTTQKYTLDTTAAVRALKTLSGEVDKHSKKLAALRDMTKEQTTAARNAGRGLDTFSDKLSKASSKISSELNPKIKTAATSMERLGRNADNLSGRFASLRGNVASVDRLLGSSARRFQTFNDNLSRANRAVSSEERVVRRLTDTLRDFDREMHVVVRTMSKKNLTAEQQAKLMLLDSVNSRQLARTILGLNSNFNLLTGTMGRTNRGFVASVTFATLLHQAVLKLLGGIRDSVGEARDFNRAIGEIQTISQKGSLSTATWADNLRQLGRTFGTNEVETAEAAYQALSNQVVTAAQTQEFLRQEIELSITAVATLDRTVAATTGIINAYHYEVERTAEVNAILFKTVELGRLRLENMSDTLGRVAITSSQLGISFIEQQAAIALLTRQGINAEEAITLLRNVELRLIRPTETLNKIFEEWGVTSGQSAVATFGLVGVMERLFEHSKKNGDVAEEMGEIFQRLRAIVGAAALSQNNYRQELEKFSDAGVTKAKALEIQMQNLGYRADREINKVKIFFSDVFGDVILEKFVLWAEYLGGADQVMRRLINTLGLAAAAYLSYRAGLIAASIATSVLTVRTQAAATGMTLFRTALSTVHPAVLITTVAVTALTFAFAQSSFAATKAALEIKTAGIAARSAFDERTAISFAEANGRVVDSFIAIRNQTERTYQEYAQFSAGVRAESNRLKDAIDQEFKAIGESLKDNLSEPFKELEEQIKALRDEAEDQRREAERNVQDVERQRENLDRERRGEQRDREFTDAVGRDGTPLRTQVDNLTNLRDRYVNEARNAIGAGNKDLAQEIYDQIDRINDEIKQRLENLKRDASKTVRGQDQVVNIGGQRFTIPGEDREQDQAAAARAEIDLQRLEDRRRAIKDEQLRLQQQLLDNEERIAQQQEANAEQQVAQAEERATAIEEEKKRYDELLKSVEDLQEQAGDTKNVEAFQQKLEEVTETINDLNISVETQAQLLDIVTRLGENYSKNVTFTETADALRKVTEEFEKLKKESATATDNVEKSVVNRQERIREALASTTQFLAEYRASNQKFSFVDDAVLPEIDRLDKLVRVIEETYVSGGDVSGDLQKLYAELDDVVTARQEIIDGIRNLFGDNLVGDAEVDQIINGTSLSEIIFSLQQQLDIINENKNETENFKQEQERLQKKLEETTKKLQDLRREYQPEAVKEAEEATKDYTERLDEQVKKLEELAKKIREVNTAKEEVRKTKKVQEEEIKEIEDLFAGADFRDLRDNEAEAQAEAQAAREKAEREAAEKAEVEARTRANQEQRLGEIFDKLPRLRGDARSKALEEARELADKLFPKQEKILERLVVLEENQNVNIKEYNAYLVETIKLMEQLDLIETKRERAARQRRERESDRFHRNMGRALGGEVRGIDNNLVAMSDREFVMNPRATQMYRPLLQSLNAQTTNYKETGSVYNFGDINMALPSGTSENQVNSIVRQLRRRIRMGLS